MRILLLLIALFSVSFADNIRSNTDFNPKPLQRQLEKIGMCADFRKDEIVLPEGHSDGMGKFFSINCSNGQLYYVYIGRVNSCRAGGCSIDSGKNPEFEFFDYYTIYDSACKVVTVNVYNYEATHGQEITARGWLKQFVGYNKNAKIEAGKNIDAISGATISVNGIVDDIRERTALLTELID